MAKCDPFSHVGDGGRCFHPLKCSSSAIYAQPHVSTSGMPICSHGGCPRVDSSSQGDVGCAFLLKLQLYIKNADGSIGEDSVILGHVQASMTEQMVAKHYVSG